jgi:hypothetical protein
MTLRQASLFVLYYTVFQFALVAVADLVLRRFLGFDITWGSLFLAFVLLTCCGPVFVALVYWFRASRERPGAFAIRFGLSMCVMLMLYALMVTLSAERIGLSFLSVSALPGYFTVTAGVGFPVFSLIAYLLWRLRGDSGRCQSL